MSERAGMYPVLRHCPDCNEMVDAAEFRQSGRPWRTYRRCQICRAKEHLERARREVAKLDRERDQRRQRQRQIDERRHRAAGE